MYEIINLTTKATEGIFATYESAENWVKAHGDAKNFRILPW
jgi:hypothetical protein